MPEVRARVIQQEKDLYRIKSESGEKLAEVSGKFRYDAVSVSDFPAVGDYVTVKWPDDDSNAIITSLFPRKNCFLRRAAGKAQEQVIAANIDYVFLCMSLNNDFNLRRLERYLSIAWESGTTPIILLTKKDLCPDFEQKLHDTEIIAAGADVYSVSSASDDYSCVYNYVTPGKTVAFIGSSGVGKSTLINKLIGSSQLETRKIGSFDKGRHTTTHRELIELENGAFVIDTPGMRELGMWDSSSGIDREFADIQELTAKCRFSDCRHISEPGCAVRAAIADGTLTEERWNSYLKLKAENSFTADSITYLKTKQGKFKKIAKLSRSRK